MAEEKSEREKNNRLFERGQSNHFEELNAFSHIPGNLSKPLIKIKLSCFCLSDDKFVNSFTGLIQEPTTSTNIVRTRRALPVECENLPVYKNWIEEGAMTPVQNQQPCNNSYLMAALAIVESSVAIENAAVPLKLSAQNLLECIKVLGLSQSSGCSGGSPVSIWRYARDKKGLVAEASYNPYNGDPSHECVSGLARTPESEVDFWQQLPIGDEEAMKCRLALYGPILASIRVRDTSIRRYKSGIWDDPLKTCSSTTINDHAVVVVGYGSELSRLGVSMDYWIVQNSWGPEWGQSGTFKISRNTNTCGIGSYSWFVVTKPKIEYRLIPVIPPSFCLDVGADGDVYQSNSYIKSLCVFEFFQNYENSRTNCVRYGMRLYKLDSYEANSTLIAFASKKYLKFSLTVNGRESYGCQNLNNDGNIMKIGTVSCERLNYAVCEYIRIVREYQQIKVRFKNKL